MNKVRLIIQIIPKYNIEIINKIKTICEKNPLRSQIQIAIDNFNNSSIESLFKQNISRANFMIKIYFLNMQHSMQMIRKQWKK